MEFADMRCFNALTGLETLGLAPPSRSSPDLSGNAPFSSTSRTHDPASRVRQQSCNSRTACPRSLLGKSQVDGFACPKRCIPDEAHYREWLVRKTCTTQNVCLSLTTVRGPSDTHLEGTRHGSEGELHHQMPSGSHHVIIFVVVVYSSAFCLDRVFNITKFIQ